MSDLVGHRNHRSHTAPEKRDNRKSHSSKGAGGSKGGQSHGQKGMWNPVDDGSLTAATTVDQGDPNWDPEDASYVLISDSKIISPPNGMDGELPGVNLPTFKKSLGICLEEYFLSEDVAEVLRSLVELASPTYHYELVKRGINMSLDKNDHERELVSKLLSEAYPQVLTTADVAMGFRKLFEMIDDIQIDAPNARTLVASFLARAVVDEILPPSFLSNPHIVSLGGDIVEGARRLLSRDHVLSRLEKVWGPGDGRPVEELKVAIDQLLDEFLLSRQLDEATQCVRELNCPHFHHEIVKRAVRLAIDKSDEDRTATSSLLAYLSAQEVVSATQMKKGFERLYVLMPDLVLDTPAALELLNKFVAQAKTDGCLPASYSGE
ncbi:unnamed protein product [Chrysoparadoxa australica]